MSAICSSPRRHFLALAAVAAFTLSSGVNAADVGQDPAAKAAYYTKQATDLRASAEKHLKDASIHRMAPGGAKVAHESIVQHCEKIAASLRAAADESDALAASYRSLAGEKK